MIRIRRNDTVVVLTGKYKGKQGTVIDVNFDKNLVKVAGVAIVTKHYKAKREGETSGIRKQEGFIHLSNVMILSTSDAKPCRVNFKVGEDGKKVRVCNRTKKIL